jgi:transposase
MDKNKEIIKMKFEALQPHLNEKTIRLFAAAETLGNGHGAITMVSESTGLSRGTIRRGLAELKELPSELPENHDNERIRKQGGGRKKSVDNDPTLINDLESLIEPVTRGDPDSPLLWTCKSLRNIQTELKNMKHNVNHQTISNLLHEMGYSLQANSKTKEGNQSPDRNEQFEHIYKKTNMFIYDKQPVISVDTKKKELIGNFKNNGRQWRIKGDPVQVNVHDFEDKELGKAIPFGVYDISENAGWVNVGIDHDTSAFAVASIKAWWKNMGIQIYSNAKRLMITADCGGSNGYRRKLWKVELQNFSDETGLEIHVSHLPPGTSKWNKIEHRLFSFISQNWRGKPLISHEVIVSLIAATKTNKGLKVQCELDKNHYPKGIKISDEEMQSVNIKKCDFRGEWNYTIYPRVN